MGAGGRASRTCPAAPSEHLDGDHAAFTAQGRGCWRKGVVWAWWGIVRLRFFLFFFVGVWLTGCGLPRRPGAVDVPCELWHAILGQPVVPVAETVAVPDRCDRRIRSPEPGPFDPDLVAIGSETWSSLMEFDGSRVNFRVWLVWCIQNRT